MTRGARASVVAALTGAVALLLAGRVPSAQPAVPAPRSILGFEPCADYTLATYEQTVAYFRVLADSARGRMQLVEIGKTVEGRPEIMAVISSEQNIRDLARYKGISRELALARSSPGQARNLAREGKAVVWIDFGLHSSEVAPAQAAPLLAYTAVADDSEEMRAIRENVILLLVPNLNPDGTTMVADWYMRNVGQPWESRVPDLWHRYAGHDDNRDWFMMTQPETRNAARQLYVEWFPQIVYDHHQAGPFPARIFVPPFDDPLNPNIPPLVTRGVNLLGEAMTRRLDREGKRGAISRVGFDMWWDGGMRTSPYFHNMIGLLTETAHPSATPAFDDPATFPKTFENGAPTLEPSVSYPSPYQGGDWHLRDSCNYIVTASLAVLDEGAKRREEWLYDIYQMGRNAIAANKDEAFLIPADQWDRGTAAKLVNALQLGGVEVEQTTDAFRAAGRQYAAGTYVIRGAQPFEPYVKDLLLPQLYPDTRVLPGGPPKEPYDVTGWTLSYQMGVAVDHINEPLALATDRVTSSGPARGAGPLARGSGPLAQGSGPLARGSGPLARGSGPLARSLVVLDPRANDSFIAVNRLLKAGAPVLRAKGPMPGVGGVWPAGAFLVASGTAGLREAVQSLGLEVAMIDKAPPGDAARLRLPRIGVYHAWGGNVDEGWTRWVLEQFEFPYVSVHDAEIRAGNLQAMHDVIVLPDATYEEMLDGLAAGSMPPEYTGGMTARGVANLEAFVKAGGTLVALDRATSLPLSAFDLPIRNVTARLRNSEFYVPGTIVRLKVDPSNPLAYGMPAEAAAFLMHSPAFAIDPGASADVAAAYPTHDLLMSGWLLGEPMIAGRAAVVDAVLGRGQVVLLGFGAQHRGQTHGTFKFLFNSFLMSNLR